MAAIRNLSGSVLRNSGKFPENFIKTNPQISTAVMETNLGHANYHSLQTQVSLRPTAGVSTAGNLHVQPESRAGSGRGSKRDRRSITDPTDRWRTTRSWPAHRKHALVNYGTFELPIGPNKLLFGNSSGYLGAAGGRLAGQLGCEPGVRKSCERLGPKHVVRSWRPGYRWAVRHQGPNYLWKEGNASGNIFADDNGQPVYTRVKDPQCNNPSYVVAYFGRHLYPQCGPECEWPGRAADSTSRKTRHFWSEPV